MLQKLIEGSVVMLMGMGTVFIFLIIMIMAMDIMSKAIQLLNKYCPEAIENMQVQKKVSTDDEIAAAIAIALSK